MQIELLRYDGRAWSRPFPALDSDRTLLLVFGASSYLNEPEPINELTGAFPSSHIVGCSSAGEIFEDMISDGSLSVAIAQFAETDLRVGVAAVGSQSSRGGRRRPGPSTVGAGSCRRPRAVGGS